MEPAGGLKSETCLEDEETFEKPTAKLKRRGSKSKKGTVKRKVKK